jgi:transcriptional regulator with XRE-family HTH domain
MLGKKIRQYREEKDLSLREMAERIGRSAAFLSDIEHGKRFPSEKVLREIANLFRVKVEELAEHDERIPMRKIGELSESNPQYAVLFRKVADKVIEGENPEEMMRVIDHIKPKKIKKRK